MDPVTHAANSGNLYIATVATHSLPKSPFFAGDFGNQDEMELTKRSSSDQQLHPATRGPIGHPYESDFFFDWLMQLNATLQDLRFQQQFLYKRKSIASITSPSQKSLQESMIDGREMKRTHPVLPQPDDHQLKPLPFLQDLKFGTDTLKRSGNARKDAVGEVNNAVSLQRIKDTLKNLQAEREKVMKGLTDALIQDMKFDGTDNLKRSPELTDSLQDLKYKDDYLKRAGLLSGETLQDLKFKDSNLKRSPELTDSLQDLKYKDDYLKRAGLLSGETLQDLKFKDNNLKRSPELTDSLQDLKYKDG